MTIELNVPFDEKEDALEFQRYLKEDGCQSRLETKLEFQQILIYRGTIENIETLYTTIETRDRKKPIWENEAKTINTGRKWIKNYKSHLKDIYTACGSNVEYASREEILNAVNDIDTTASLQKKADFAEIERKTMDRTEALNTLDKNGCIHENPDTKYLSLIKKKPIEDLEIDVWGSEIFYGLNPADLENANISMLMKAVTSNKYTVRIGPEVMLMDLVDMIDYLSDYFDINFDDGPIFQLKLYMILKHQFKQIIKEGNVSPSNLANKLAEMFDEGQIAFLFSNDSIQSFLTDLKKIGFITLKNGVIKLCK